MSDMQIPFNGEILLRNGLKVRPLLPGERILVNDLYGEDLDELEPYTQADLDQWGVRLAGADDMQPFYRIVRQVEGTTFVNLSSRWYGLCVSCNEFCRIGPTTMCDKCAEKRLSDPRITRLYAPPQPEEAAVSYASMPIQRDSLLPADFSDLHDDAALYEIGFAFVAIAFLASIIGGIVSTFSGAGFLSSATIGGVVATSIYFVGRKIRGS